MFKFFKFSLSFVFEEVNLLIEGFVLFLEPVVKINNESFKVFQLAVTLVELFYQFLFLRQMKLNLLVFLNELFLFMLELLIDTN